MLLSKSGRTLIRRLSLALMASVTLVVAAASSAQAEVACPNEAVREAQYTTALGDCRAYEMVSPTDKNGADITLGDGSFRASSVGGAIVFDSNVASGDAQSTGATGVITFRSDRRDSGWSAHTLFPPQAPNPFGIFNGPIFRWFSPDLSRGVLAANDPPLVEGAPTGVQNLYLTDGNGSSPVLLTASVNPVFQGPFSQQIVADASADMSHVVFESAQDLTSDAPSQSCPCNSRVYEWHDGTVQLLSVLPDGTPAESAVAGPFNGINNGADGNPVVSEDGERVYFSAPNANGASLLYLRKHGSETAWVSESEASSPDLEPRTPTFLQASADGTRAFFTTTERLLDTDTNTQTDLYMYTDSPDPSHESNLTLISQDKNSGDGTDADVKGVLGISKDGGVVYFAAEHSISLGEGEGFGTKLYVWDHGTIKFISYLPGFDADNWSPVPVDRTSQVAKDGRYLLFMTATPQVASFDSAGHVEIYRYDLQTGAIICISCGMGTGPAHGNASITFTGAGGTRGYLQTSLRSLSSDGTRVFFDTSEALVPQDTNGKIDAYEWENGAVHLISNGHNATDSYFVNASANGDDAYFATRERLVGWDTDTLLDLYDARTDGGFPEPPPQQAVCTGELCQGAISPPPPSVLTLGIGQSGSGNLNPPVAKSLTKAQKLTRALHTCKKKRKKKQRKKCESRAGNRYGADKASKNGGSK